MLKKAKSGIFFIFFTNFVAVKVPMKWNKLDF